MRVFLTVVIASCAAVLMTSCGSGAGQAQTSSTGQAQTPSTPQASTTSSGRVPMMAKAIVARLKALGLPIGPTAVYTAASDPNHLLGRPGQYTSKVNFRDTRLPAAPDFDISSGGSVEVFATGADAQRRYKYVHAVTQSVSPFVEYEYLDGRILLRLSQKLTPKQARQYAAALKVASSTTTPPPSTTTAGPARYTLTIRTSPAGSAGFSVHGKTNLPDGAIINLTAAQAFRFSSEHQIRESQVAHAKTVTVKSGTFSTSMGPLDYGDITAGLQRGGEPGFGAIVDVDSAVTVCAAFETGNADNGKPRQPDSAVRSAVGAHGENLKNSPHKTVFGSLTPHPSTWLEATTRASVGAQNAAAAVTSAQGTAPTLKRLHGFCFS